MTPTVLVLELNELCTPLLDRFMAEGLLPNVARLRAESARFTTDAVASRMVEIYAEAVR